MSNATTAKNELGARCPSGGNLYICHDHPSRFVGCCKSDPCKSLSGRCAAADLTPMSYDEDKHDLISEQECQAPFNVLANDNDDTRKVRREDDGDYLWYACGMTDPSFMGCCKSNPCSSNGCPKEDLGGAKVTSDTTKAWPFFGDQKPATTTSSISPTATYKISKPTSRPSTGKFRHTTRPRLSAGAIAGIAGGAAIAVILLLAIIGFRCWRAKRRDRKASASSYEPAHTQHPLMPDSVYSHTPTNSQHVSSPRTPLNSPPPSDGHMSQQSDYSYQPQLAELHPTDVDRGLRSGPMSGMHSPPYWSGTQWVYPQYVSVIPASAPSHVQSFKVAGGRDVEEELAELPCNGEGGREDRQSWGVGDDNQRLAGTR